MIREIRKTSRGVIGWEMDQSSEALVQDIGQFYRVGLVKRARERKGSAQARQGRIRCF